MTRPQVQRVSELIDAAPLRQYIDAEGAQILAERAASEVVLKDGEYLYHKGDAANSFFIVAEGRLASVGKELREGERRILHVLEQGDLLGELSFIDGTPRTLSVCALGDASVLCFEAEDILPLSSEHPQLIFDFMRAVIKRVHHTLSAIIQQQSELTDYITSGARGRR
jgi:CRP-like cAMP-binding protein